MVAKWVFRRFMGLQVYMYRRSGGKSMSRVRGMPILLLTTVGRKSGKRRVTPVMYIRDGADYIITASNNGADDNPGWFFNLKFKPQTTIEVEGTTKMVTARRATDEEKGRLWPQLIEKAPFFDGYRKKAKRDIPMLILQPVEGQPEVSLAPAKD